MMPTTAHRFSSARSRTAEATAVCLWMVLAGISRRFWEKIWGSLISAVDGPGRDSFRLQGELKEPSCG